jgi:hypothetical protein
MRGTVLERFEQYYIPEPNSGCWLWIGSCNDKGYGIFCCRPRLTRSNSGMTGAHIGLHVLHDCDNPCCVNPDHLHLGTHQDNMRERELRHRRAPPTGSKNGRANITEADVLAIRADNRWPRFIAKEWNIPVSTIKKIRNRVTWKHVK